MVPANRNDAGSGTGNSQIVVDGQLADTENNGPGQPRLEVHGAAARGVGDGVTQGARPAVQEVRDRTGDGAVLQVLEPWTEGDFGSDTAAAGPPHDGLTEGSA